MCHVHCNLLSSEKAKQAKLVYINKTFPKSIQHFVTLVYDDDKQIGAHKNVHFLNFMCPNKCFRKVRKPITLKHYCGYLEL